MLPNRYKSDGWGSNDRIAVLRPTYRRSTFWNPSTGNYCYGTFRTKDNSHNTQHHYVWNGNRSVSAGRWSKGHRFSRAFDDNWRQADKVQPMDRSCERERFNCSIDGKRRYLLHEPVRLGHTEYWKHHQPQLPFNQLDHSRKHQQLR